MRTIKTYFKGAPFYNAFLRLYPAKVVATPAEFPFSVTVELSLMNPYWIQTQGIRLAIIPRPQGRDWLLDDLRFLRRAVFPEIRHYLILSGIRLSSRFVSHINRQ